MRKATFLFTLLVLAMGWQVALAQKISGKVVGEDGKGLKYVNCVLRNTADKSYIASAVTNEEGEFSLQSTARDCTLSLKMLGFVSKEMECEAGDLGTILLRKETKPSEGEEVNQNFPPIVMDRDTMTYHIDHKPMKGRKKASLVMMGNTLIYNIDRIPFAKTFANAKELIMELPSVVSPDGNRLEAVGGKKTTVVVRGSFENPDDIKDLLKSTPAERVKRVVVRYENASAGEWTFNEATINVILRRK